MSDLPRENPLLTDSDRQRYMMVLSYDGAPFNGWQVQPNAVTVQEKIEEALRTLLKTPLHIVGAGRTDTGVSARHMVAHFDVPSSVASLIDEQRLRKALNSILRPAIAVHGIVRTLPDRHARFDAESRTYRYYLHMVHDPFRTEKSLFWHQKTDFDLMNAEVASLLGKKDFTSFSKLHTDTNNNLCEVTSAGWHRYGPSHYYFEITANRFLRNMVRSVVGTLLDVGVGKYPPGHIKNILEKHDRCAAGTSMPGNALFLWDIGYPYELPANLLPEDMI